MSEITFHFKILCIGFLHLFGGVVVIFSPLVLFIVIPGYVLGPAAAAIGMGLLVTLFMSYLIGADVVRQ